jgi:hypothetical protein
VGRGKGEEADVIAFVVVFALRGRSGRVGMGVSSTEMGGVGRRETIWNPYKRTRNILFVNPGKVSRPSSHAFASDGHCVTDRD